MKESRYSILPLLVLLATLALPAGGAARASDSPTALGGEIGVLAGILLSDDDLAGESGNLEFAIGARGGSQFSSRLTWFADGLFSNVSTKSRLGDARQYYGRTGLEWQFIKNRSSSWFVNGAFGWLLVDYEYGTVEDFHRPLISAGFGQRYQVGGRKYLRWELRGDVTVDNHPGLGGATMQQGLALVGLIWGPSRKNLAYHDEDSDGVRNSNDHCPLSPTGAMVDKNGCPMDSDGDSVPDGIDYCARTQIGQLVDDTGCPRDSDGDGIFDGSDACPDTSENLAVDEWGCPRDRDRDGVPDDLDDCPQTELGIGVDDQGCAMDSDGDGISDGLDLGPATPEGTFVDAKGCTTSPFLWVPERRTLIVWVEFEVNSSVLDEQAKSLLDEVIPVLLDSSYRFEIGGHIDEDAGESDLDRLTYKRAEAVRDYVVAEGMEAHRLETEGYGSSEPLSDDTPVREFGGGRIEFKRID